jgi:hypothetical protein
MMKYTLFGVFYAFYASPCVPPLAPSGGGIGSGGSGLEDEWLIQMLRDMLHGNSTGSEASLQVAIR